MTRRRRLIALGLTIVLVAPLAAAAQEPEWDSRRPIQTRAMLEDLLRRLEQAAQSEAYSAAMRGDARAEADRVRQRLRQGDFQVSDRVRLWVEGEQQLTDTFTVVAGPALVLPQIGEVSLAGVLRAELEPHLAEQLGRVLRAPVVRARSLIRVSVLGEVARPGFYVLPIETLPEEALMAAGGPTRDAKLAALRIERGDIVLWSGDALARALAAGRTLDDLNLRAGDRLVLPRRAGDTLRVVGVLLSLPAAIYGLTRLF